MSTDTNEHFPAADDAVAAIYARQLAESEQQLVAHAVHTQLGITLPLEVLHTRAALAQYGSSLTRFTAHRLQQLFGDPIEDESHDVNVVTDNIEARVSSLYGDLLELRNESSPIRHATDYIRVSRLAKGIGKVGILATAGASSFVTGKVTHQIVDDESLAIAGYAVGLGVGHTLIPTAVRNTTHRVLGDRFDQFLRPVSNRTWFTYEQAEQARREQGLPGYSLPERAHVIRQLEIEQQIAELHRDIQATVHDWQLDRDDAVPITALEAATVVSQATVDHIGRVLGVINNQNGVTVEPV